MKLALVVTIRIVPGKEPEVHEVIRKLAESTLKEPGVERYDVYVDRENPRNLVLHELYRDEDAFTAHRENPHLKNLVSHIEEWVEGGKFEILRLAPFV